jgi:hypothetical protein
MIPSGVEISIIALLLIAGLAVGVISLLVFLFSRLGTTGRVILAVVLLVLVLPLAVLMIFRVFGHPQAGIGAMPKVTFIAIPGLLMLAGLVALLIYLFTRLGGTGRAVLALVILAVLAPLAILLLRSTAYDQVGPAASYEYQEYPSAISVEPTGEVTAVNIVPAPPGPWQITDDLPFDADNYPTINSAARGLTKKLTKAIKEKYPAETQIPHVIIGGSVDESVLSTVFATLIENLSLTLAEVQLHAGKKSPLEITDTDTVIAASVDVTVVGSVGVSGSPPYSTQDNTLQIKAQGPDFQFHYSVNYADKPWADNFAAFVSANPSQNWILAQSPQPASSPDEAASQAINNAASKLYQQIAKQGPPMPIPQIERELSKDYLVSDRFVQKISRPYGDVWREALLVNAAPDNLQQLVYQHQTVRRAQAWSWVRHIGSALGLLAVICLVYIFLNAATKGYYVWSLRIATGVLALVVIFLFLFQA